jgi:hypothetical protein
MKNIEFSRLHFNALIVVLMLFSHSMVYTQNGCPISIQPNPVTICRGEKIVLEAKHSGALCQLSDLPPNLQQGLVAWYPFCGNANDVSGNGHHGTVMGATLTTDRFGMQNGAYHFNGSSYISVPNHPGLNVDSITIVAFIKPNPGATKGIIVAKSDMSNATKFSYHLTHEATYAGQTGFMCSWGDGNCNVISVVSGQHLFAATGLFSGQTWDLAAMTVDATGFCNMYKDNQMVSQGGGIIPMGKCNLTQSTLRIGGPWWINDPYYFRGDIDDVMIFDRPLSQAEIQQLYQLTPTGNVTGNYLWSNGQTTASIQVSPSQTTTYTVLFSNTTVSCSAQAVVHMLPTSLPITGNVNVQAGQTEVYSAPYYPGIIYNWNTSNGAILSGQGSNTIQVQWNNFSPTGSVGLTVCNLPNSVQVNISGTQPPPPPPPAVLCNLSQLPTNLQQGLMAFYPFCGNANDESGNGNHGLVNGAILSTDRFGTNQNGYFFNGINDYIEVPNSNTINMDSITIIAFIKPTLNTVKGIIVAKSDINSANYFSYHLTHEATYNNNTGLMGSWGLGNCSVNSISNSANCFAPSGMITGQVWDMVALTVDATGTGSVYVNGQLVSQAQTSQSMASCNDPVSTLRIGGPWWTGDPYFFNGDIDDIFIYNRVLSATEIQQFTQVLTHNQNPSDFTPKLMIAPNPAQVGFDISVTGIDTPLSVEIYTIAGQKVFQGVMDTHLQIDNNNHQQFSKGMYVVKVFQEGRNSYWSEKLIVN